MSSSSSSPTITHATAQDVIERAGLLGRLTGKVILITGGSSGIGVETARSLYETGAHLYLPVRDQAKAEAVKQEIEATAATGSAGRITLLSVDLQSLDSVRQCAADFLARSSQLNVLICNAAVFTVSRSTTQDGLEAQFGVCHIAHFLLFQLLKQTLLSSATPDFHSRVVCLSSRGHWRSPILFDDLNLTQQQPYDKWVAYGQAKTANVYMASEIERRYGGRRLHAASVQPGGSMESGLMREMSEEERSNIKQSLAGKWKTVQQCAATTVWAAVSREWEEVGGHGKYCEALQVAVPAAEESGEQGRGGYVAHTYDEEAAKRLWDVSLNIVGIKEDERS